MDKIYPALPYPEIQNSVPFTKSRLKTSSVNHSTICFIMIDTLRNDINYFLDTILQIISQFLKKMNNRCYYSKSFH